MGINDGINDGKEATLTTDAVSNGKAMNFKTGTLKIDGWEEQITMEQGDTSLVFMGKFSKGSSTMSAWFTNEENKNWGSY